MPVLLDFVARIAWPMVALVGILILGPGRVLEKLIVQLTTNLFRITDSISQFKQTANDFHKTQVTLQESTHWVAQLQDQLSDISGRLESISVIAQELAISEGNRSLERAVTDDGPVAAEAVAEGMTADQMFDDIRDRWEQLIERMRQLIGPEQFDARSVGQMAWKLVDGRRAHPLTNAEAELVERLYSQLKRFNRLQSSKQDWLTHEIYSAFVRGVEQARGALD